MALYNTKAIVLRSINLSETDKLVSFLTETYGKIKCVAKAARKMKSRFGAALEPMSYIRMIYFGKENQDLYRLNHSDIILSFQPVRDDIRKLYTGIYFNELVDSMVAEGHAEKPVFDLLLDSLQAIQIQEDIHTLCRLFEIRLLRHLGYSPQLDHCVVCRAVPDSDWVGFSFHRRAIVCTSCTNRNGLETRVGTGILNYLKKLQTMEIRNCDRLKFPRGSEEEVEQLTHRLVLSHVGRELKSYPFIKQMAALG